MELSTKMLRAQIALLKPFVDGCTLETVRKGQDAMGLLMAATHKNKVRAEDCAPVGFPCSMITPTDEVSNNIILYLHGGGYTCGDLAYARGFGTVLSAECGIRVFCAAYRLAPEAPYPAALEDALSVYRYLLEQGYPAQNIVLCGESAGGGLCYALCLKLKALGEEMPAGIIGISPWTDLTLSGASFEKNREADPSLTKARLQFYADCYVHGTPDGNPDEIKDRLLKTDAYVSPLFGDLRGLPASLLFVGGDEILLDDTRLLHEKLQSHKCRSQMIVAPGMWHGYVLFCLKENAGDFDRINTFLKMVLPRQKKLRWMRLDNAAKIYPAARRRNWSNFFRVSATLNEEIDLPTMRAALDVTVRRFPSMAVRLRRGLFWYYLEEIPHAPEIMEEAPYPLARMPFDDVRKCAFRVLVYKNRVAGEFFHALTDGNGGLIFLKTLVAEYLTQRYAVQIPTTDGVLNRIEEPHEAELEDSFLKYSGPVSMSRSEPTAYHVKGTFERDGYRNITTMMMDASDMNEKAKALGVTVTAYLSAAITCAIMDIQNETVRKTKRQKPVRILIPVNLRKLYGSKTLRNFVLYVTPGVDPRLGTYTFEEVCSSIYHQMGYAITPKQMSMRIAANVNTEKAFILKIMPLFIKNAAMKMVFNMVGERKSCLSVSNLGVVHLPPEMSPFVSRMEMVLGVQASSPYNCGIVTYNNTMYLNIIRNIKEPKLESRLFSVLKSRGIHVKVESNQRQID